MDSDSQDGRIMLKEFLQSVDFSIYWNYDGSLTVPPCQEDIKWTVIKDVQSISPKQLARITSHLANNFQFAGGRGNNREVRPLGDRKLYYSNAIKATATLILTTTTLVIFLVV